MYGEGTPAVSGETPALCREAQGRGACDRVREGVCPGVTPRHTGAPPACAPPSREQRQGAPRPSPFPSHTVVPLLPTLKRSLTPSLPASLSLTPASSHRPAPPSSPLPSPLSPPSLYPILPHMSANTPTSTFKLRLKLIHTATPTPACTFTHRSHPFLCVSQNQRGQTRDSPRYAQAGGCASE